jgi:hypothetical protein
MGKKKKETIRIIRKDSNKEDYTFVSNNSILNNIRDNESAATNNDKTLGDKSKERIEKKKIYSKKSQYKGRKILGKSMQGHSPVYE